MYILLHESIMLSMQIFDINLLYILSSSKAIIKYAYDQCLRYIITLERGVGNNVYRE